MKKEYDFNKMRRRPSIMRDLAAPKVWDRQLRIRTRVLLDKEVLDWCRERAHVNGERVGVLINRLLREHKEIEQAGS